MEEVMFPEFTFLRPVFISIIAVLVLVLFVITYQRKALINEFFLWFIVDEYNLSGDEQSFDMFLGLIVISILNVIIDYIKKGRI
ncbi:hypothetical protein AAIE21_14680 [Paenibacillus sp. 102]|uniref:hypothetical protein n=1 Tax=Paenibacillus sp. 102 TaxID=3120823 RepID=UPI0031B9DD02